MLASTILRWCGRDPKGLCIYAGLRNGRGRHIALEEEEKANDTSVENRRRADPAWNFFCLRRGHELGCCRPALGRPGAVQAGGVYRVAFPRSDLNVTLDGVALKPGFALGGWLAFEPTGDHAMVMGDFVLTEDEVSPVMQKMVENGIEITALHNQLLRANPATLYMHIICTSRAKVIR